MILVQAGVALAQDQAKGFALNRFDPSERGSEWFVLDSLDLRGDARIAAGVVGDWAHKPLVLYNEDGSVDKLLVGDQLYVHVGASLVLWSRLRLSLNIPIAAYERGEEGIVDGVTYQPPAKVALGDIRAAADVRLLGDYGSFITLAAGVAVYAPTGNRDDYTGDGKIRIMPRVLAAGDIGPLTYAARLAFQYRALDGQYAAGSIGSEALFGAAVGVRLADKKLVVGPEFYGSTVVSESDAFFKKLSTPMEILIGGHYLIADQVRAGLGVGPGLTRAFGTPQFRVLASVEYAPAFVPPPPPPPPDRDGDRILDKDDACPDVPGLKTSDPKTNGCPPPPDRDEDGILDADDACPDVPGLKTSDPKTNGCPPPADRDGDGIVDNEDACPDVPGVKTSDPKTNGCPPPPDRDGDGIIDAEDACPDAPGPKSDDPKLNGCPPARIEAGEIKILEQVKFKTGSAVILPESDAILTAVLTILNEHPEIKKLMVEGHTDNRGGAAYNLRLSDKRAQSVVTWLVKHGADNGRLASKGFGLTRPLAPNTTEDGRRENRRVEFHIEKTDAPPVEGKKE
jgi:outer membrane protein OmpA-like peptidoglycan-associated protein